MDFISSILSKERYNTTRIYLYKEGVFLKCCQASALLFIKYLKFYQDRTKYIKSEKSRVCSVGFPASSSGDICPEYDDRLKRPIQSYELDKDGFDSWYREQIFTSQKQDFPIVSIPVDRLFANLYLNDPGHFVKRKLKVRYYGRYVDDMLPVDSTLQKLYNYCEAITTYLSHKLCLRPHPKKEYLQDYIYQRFFVLGTHIKPYRTYICKRTVSNIHQLLYQTKALKHFYLICHGEIKQQ